MFCPKCGTKNPDNGRFCRSCGADLGNVSEALSGNLKKPQNLVDRKGKPVNWESAIVKMFTGLAFVAVTIALAFSQMGRGWWFWMLIPAFGALGSGVAQLVQLKKSESQNTAFIASNNQNTLSSASRENALPSSETAYVEIQNLVHSGNLIEAIKVHRETFGSNLNEAKQAIEKIEREQTVQKDYVKPPKVSIYDTGDLQIPPSVTENTTRHLEINQEGETMSLPKK